MANVLETRTNLDVENLSLREGDRYSQGEFHRRYERTTSTTRYELLNGTVHMTPAERAQHGRYEQQIGLVLGIYEGKTPGVVAAHNSTLIFDENNELQPDVHLRILPEFQGASRIDANGYLSGPPEFVVEVAYSSLRKDLSVKRDVYRAQGVREYLVVCVEPAELRWFVWPEGERQIDGDGVLRSVNFPGLWFDSHALFQEQTAKLIETIQTGLATVAHSEFVEMMNLRQKC